MGWFSNLGHDISHAFSDVGHFLSNPVHDLELAAGAAAVALPFLAPEILGGLGGAAGLGGLFGAGDVAAGAGAAGLTDLGVAGLTAPGVGLGVLGDVGAGTAAADLGGGALALTADASGGALTGGTSALDAVLAQAPADVGAATLPGVSDIGAGITSLASTGGAVDATAGLGDVAAGTAADTSGGFLSSLGSSIMKNPLQAVGMGLGGAGILTQLARMGMGLPYESQLKAQAGQAGAVAAQDQAQAAALGAPLATGTLPPQWESAVQTAAQQGRDAIASKYASMGLSNSSSEAGDIAALDARLPEIRMQIAQSMAQIGVQYGNQALAAMGLQDNIYTALMDANIKQDQALAQSIAAFAGAAGRSQAVKSS